jgi:hypothetical protein
MLPSGHGPVATPGYAREKRLIARNEDRPASCRRRRRLANGHRHGRSQSGKSLEAPVGRTPGAAAGELS